MAVRRWVVGPDPATGVVDRQELIQAILDGEAMLWRGGGALSILVGRHPTHVPHEMVTTSAVIEWKDRTNAKPQPETAGDVVPAAPGLAPIAAVPDDDEPLEEGVEIDGLDPRALPEEDVSSIPVSAR